MYETIKKKMRGVGTYFLKNEITLDPKLQEKCLTVIKNALREMPSDFQNFEIVTSKRLAEEIREGALDSLPEGNLKQKIHDIVTSLERLYPEFETLYNDIRDLVLLVEKKKGVKEKWRKVMMQCGERWGRYVSRGKMTQAGGKDIFDALKIMVTSMKTTLKNNPRVLYISEFLENLSNYIGTYKFPKNEYLMFKYAEFRISYYDAPASEEMENVKWVEHVAEDRGFVDASEAQGLEMGEMKLASSELGRSKGHMRTLLMELEALGMSIGETDEHDMRDMKIY
jgi:hypothetical protein